MFIFLCHSLKAPTVGPQVKRVGNPSENKERFRTSRNDRLTNKCGFANDRISNSDSSLKKGGIIDTVFEMQWER